VPNVSAQGAPLILGQFICAVYPSTAAVKPPTPPSQIPASFLYVDTPYYPDLIFSVQLNKSARTDLFLNEIQFEIPLGPRSSRPVSDGGFVSPGLMDVYTGPGARMLSNQRWVVHHDHVSANNERETSFILRLIPRSLLNGYPIGRNANLSFRLNECPISPFEQPHPTSTTTEICHIKVTEIYRKYTAYKPDKWDPQGNGGSTIVITKKTGWKPREL